MNKGAKQPATALHVALLSCSPTATNKRPTMKPPRKHHSTYYQFLVVLTIGVINGFYLGTFQLWEATGPDDTTLPLQSLSMFYNIYVPSSNQLGALDIVREQLNILRTSYVATQNLTLYYNTMGENCSSRVSQLCQEVNIQCQFLKHYDQGDEIYTLQALHDHCWSRLHPNRVGYFHNKGSFHDTRANQKLRPPLTMAVAHPDCWNPPVNYTCNTCGLVFLDLPFAHMPGNFFVADCHYVRQLISPLQFERHMDKLVEHVNQSTPYNISGDPLATRESWLGLGRYAAEHWLHCHPTVMPCDLSQRLSVFYRPKPQRMRLQMYPRPALTKSQNQPSVTFDDYFSIHGQLYKWKYLYPKSFPPNNSWIWKRYPELDASSLFDEG